MNRVAFISPTVDQALFNHGKMTFEHSIAGTAYLLDADFWSGSYCSANYRSLEPYDFILVNENWEMYQLTIDLRENLPPTTKVIGYADGAYQDLTRMPFIPQGMDFIRMLRSVDGFVTLVEGAIDYYKLFTDKPVAYLGMPFPYEKVKQYQVPFAEKEKLIAVAGQLTHCPLKNCIGNLFLTKKADCAKIIFLEPQPDKVKSFLDGNAFTVEMHPPFSQVSFYEKYSKCYVGINMDPLGSLGRFSLDLAGMGIPVIGGPAQQHQKKLFPQLTFDPFLEVPKIIFAYQRLFSDIDFYNECRDYALKTIETEFTDAQFMSRWENMKNLLKGADNG